MPQCVIYKHTPPPNLFPQYRLVLPAAAGAVLQVGIWPQSKVQNFTAAETQQAFKDGCQIWGRHCGLKFTFSATAGSVWIRTARMPGDIPDALAIYYEQYRMIDVANHVKFSLQSLAITVAHELGHFFGFEHSNNKSCLMYAFAAGQKDLCASEISWAQQQFGKPAAAPPPPKPDPKPDPKPTPGRVTKAGMASRKVGNRWIEVAWNPQKLEMRTRAETGKPPYVPLRTNPTVAQVKALLTALQLGGKPV